MKTSKRTRSRSRSRSLDRKRSEKKNKIRSREKNRSDSNQDRNKNERKNEKKNNKHRSNKSRSSSYSKSDTKKIDHPKNENKGKINKEIENNQKKSKENINFDENSKKFNIVDGILGKNSNDAYSDNLKKNKSRGLSEKSNSFKNIEINEKENLMPEQGEVIESKEIKNEKPTITALSSRAGGVYVPPFKLAKIYEQIKNAQDTKSEDYQRMMWEMLRKSINGIINKVNVSNIQNVVYELFCENLIRSKGILARAIIKAQMASPNFTHVYAALVAIINSKVF